MNKPTGKLAHAYQTIANLQDRADALRAELDNCQRAWELQRFEIDDLLRERDQLRAELAALKAVPEGVEVVAWMKHELCTRLYFHAPPEPSIPLMTVAQHNAIVAALSAPAAGQEVSGDIPNPPYTHLTQWAEVARPMVEALESCMELIETISPFEGDTVRKARAALAAHNSKQEAP